MFDSDLNIQEIIQGSQETLMVRLKNIANGIEGDPVDLTTITEIKTCFQNADGTELMLTKTGGAISVLGNPVLGKISIALTAAQTTLLAVTSIATLEISLIFSGADPIKIQISKAYTVLPSVC